MPILKLNSSSESGTASFVTTDQDGGCQKARIRGRQKNDGNSKGSNKGKKKNGGKSTNTKKTKSKGNGKNQKKK
jgi:hypothetical protein